MRFLIFSSTAILQAVVSQHSWFLLFRTVFFFFNAMTVPLGNSVPSWVDGCTGRPVLNGFLVRWSTLYANLFSLWVNEYLL